MIRSALIAALLTVACPAAAQDLAIRAGHVVTASETTLESAVVVVRKGRIVAVGTDVAVPEGLSLIEHPRAWIVPAFVDAATSQGLVGDLDETADAIAADLELIVDTTHRDFAAARAAGIGTCAVLPGDRNVFGGQGALVTSSGEALGGAAKLALGPTVLVPGRTPTSRSGVMDLLRRTLEGAHESETAPAPLARFASGATIGVARISGTQDALNLIELSDRFGLRLALHPAASMEPRQFEGLTLAGRAFVLGPSALNASTRALKLAAALDAQGATLAFASGAPQAPAAGLRRTAALAVRHGLAPKRALRALTQGGAEALGLDERLGTLDPGKDATFTVLDGPPLDLGARVLETYVGGRRVYRRPALKETE